MDCIKTPEALAETCAEAFLSAQKKHVDVSHIGNTSEHDRIQGVRKFFRVVIFMFAGMLKTPMNLVKDQDNPVFGCHRLCQSDHVLVFPSSISMTSRVSVSCVALKMQHIARWSEEKMPGTPTNRRAGPKSELQLGENRHSIGLCIYTGHGQRFFISLVSKMHDTLMHIMTVTIDFKQGIFTERMSLHCSILLMEYY